MIRTSVLKSGTVLGALLTVMSTAYAADDLINPTELLNLSLEQLSNIEVTSVSKKSEKASEAAAAIFVITQDDIRRSGATAIPEVLRMVPGLSVAQIDSHDWTITSRGTGTQFANKLLVLIDGRSVYTPLFSGVYWEVQDTMMQDIERIEVIRGPGATLWGANAVNGVINIITKSAKDTQGGLAYATAGNHENALSGVRYGTKIGNDTYARVYAKYDDRDNFKSVNGGKNHDAWNKMQSGFRADGTAGDNIAFTFQGDAYNTGETLQRNLPTLATPFVNTVNDRETARGANVLGRFNYKDSKDSDWTLQMYFDNVQRDNIAFSDKRNTLDLDLQRSWSTGRHEIVWGAGYRFVSDSFDGSVYLNLTPSHRNDNLVNTFIQDKIALVPDEFFLTLGSKFERNSYTGFEKQPSARLTWLINSKQTWWASAAHAVRTPNQFSDDGSIVLSAIPPDALGPGSPAAFFATTGNHGALSETLNAYETGYRIQPTKSLSFDIATYYNDYSRLITTSIGSGLVAGYGGNPVLPVTLVNGNSGTTSGVELTANWEATDYWKLTGSYTRLNFVLNHIDSLATVKGYSPKDQFNIRSSLRLPHDVEIDNALYYVSKLTGPTISGTGSNISAYARFDMRLAWKPLENLEISLVGQNLFHKDHQEFSSAVYATNSSVPRSIYGNVTWKF